MLWHEVSSILRLALHTHAVPFLKATVFFTDADPKDVLLKKYLISNVNQRDVARDGTRKVLRFT